MHVMEGKRLTMNKNWKICKDYIRFAPVTVGCKVFACTLLIDNC